MINVWCQLSSLWSNYEKSTSTRLTEMYKKEKKCLTEHIASFPPLSSEMDKIGANRTLRWMRNRDYDLSTDKRHKNLRGLNGGADFYLDLVVQTAECLRIIVVCKNKIITGIVPIGFRSVCRRTDVAGYDNPSPPTHQRKKGKKKLVLNN